MAKIVPGSESMKWLLKVLGLPKTTKRFRLTASYDEVVTVECEYYPDITIDETVTEKFRLEEIE